jgi:GH24 family phage-related lysozyme (muramidase)
VGGITATNDWKGMCAMMRDIKFAGEVTAKSGAVCREGLPGCEKKATIHVCFDDNRGEAVCRSCFVERLNRGDWNTDGTETLLLAS